MAIQISGTSVITDGRGLVNVTAIDTSTKNAIVAAGVGGAFDVSGGVGSAGIYITTGSNFPIGCLVIVNSNDSYINGSRLGYAYYGKQFTAATGTPDNRLVMYTGTSSQTSSVYKIIYTGTWRALVSGVKSGDASIICQRIS